MDALISDQTIDFDVHRAGDGQPIGLRGLHMHKRMNGKRHKGVDVLIPLDGGEDLVFRPASTADEVKTQLINEVRRTLSKDPNKQQQLVEAVVSVIERYAENDDLTPGQVIEAARNGAMNIAKVFSKNQKIQQEIEQRIDKRLKFLITSHTLDDGRTFYIKQDIERQRIKIGDDIEELNYGNERRKWPVN